MFQINRMSDAPMLSSLSKTVSHVLVCGIEKGTSLGKVVRLLVCGKWGGLILNIGPEWSEVRTDGNNLK